MTVSNVNNGIAFGHFRFGLIDGSARWALEVECSKCGRRELVQMKRSAPVELARKCMERAGWSLARNGKAAICPDHGAQKSNQPQKEPTMTKEAPAIDPIVQYKVLRDVEDNWDEKACRYLGDVTDQTIGEKFHVGWGVVKTLRETVFGRIKSDPEVEAVQAELKRGLDAVAKIEADLARALDIIAGADTRLNKLKQQRGIA